MPPRPDRDTYSRTDPFLTSRQVEATEDFADHHHNSSSFSDSFRSLNLSGNLSSSAIMSSSSSMSAFEKSQKQHERRQRRERQIAQMEMAIEASGRSLDKSFASLNAEIDGFANVATTSSSTTGGANSSSANGPGDKVQKSKEDWSAPALGAGSTARDFLAETSYSSGNQTAGEPTKRRFGFDSSVTPQPQPNLQGVSLYATGDLPKESRGGGSSPGVMVTTAFGWVKDKLTFGRGEQPSSEYGANNLAPRGDTGGSFGKSSDLRPRGYDETGRAPAGGGSWSNNSGPPGQGEGGSARDFMARCASNASMAADTLAMCMSKRCALVFAALVVAGVTVGVVTSKKPMIDNNGGGGGGASKAAPEVSVSSSSSVSGAKLSPEEKFDILKDRVVREGISLPETLEDAPRDPSDPEGPKHPQYLALKWLSSSESNGHLDPNDRFALQRYALAVFYHSTYDAAARVDELDPPSDNEDEEYINWDESDNWMTSRGICSWLGVQCHHRSGTSNMDTTYDVNGMVTYLKLPANEIRGPLPLEVFTTLTDLRVIDLKENGLNGTVPTEIGMLRQLEYVQLADNYLEGTISGYIGNCHELRQLHLSRNWMEGTIPPEIANLKKLKGLGLFHNGFSGTIPFALGELSELKNLYLDENFLTGSIPPSLALLHSLSDLRLGKNDLTGEIPTELADLPFLEILYLHSNKLTGTVPPELAQLTHLDELYLYKNNLTGTLPTQLGTMTDLDHLYLDHCQFTGSIPTEYAGMVNLQHLYAYSNALTGTIPREVAFMKDLRRINLGDNELTGTLPGESLGKMIKLEQLILENNKLVGVVPSEMGGLHKMDKLTLHGNSITGSVPAEVCDLTRAYSLDEFSMDCATPPPPPEGEGEGGAEGGGEREVSCDCCTRCEA